MNIARREASIVLIIEPARLGSIPFRVYGSSFIAQKPRRKIVQGPSD